MKEKKTDVTKEKLGLNKVVFIFVLGLREVAHDKLRTSTSEEGKQLSLA